ncbi:immune inhibitor A domain-containing protein [Candidatus Villigracilis affinis]|uniref:immune inhibitor A domain-containing protein n=1 Tax=Candidatus Villigracilis affinis TaxID=3140682 RepID=UPI0031EDED89
MEKNDRVFVIIAEFGEGIHPTYGGEPGPLHNEIAEPNRAVDNTTIWQADFNKEHFEDMYFNQMVDYYAKQSSGRYTINGDVIDWVKVPYNEAVMVQTFGSHQCSTVRYLIRDAINQWVADQKQLVCQFKRSMIILQHSMDGIVMILTAMAILMKPMAISIISKLSMLV